VSFFLSKDFLLDAKSYFFSNSSVWGVGRDNDGLVVYSSAPVLEYSFQNVSVINIISPKIRPLVSTIYGGVYLRNGTGGLTCGVRGSDEDFILTNNHCIAQDLLQSPTASRGDGFDFGVLWDWVPIDDIGVNLMDAAVGIFDIRYDGSREVEMRPPNPGSTRVYGVFRRGEQSVGLSVFKTGATSNTTYGIIQSVDVSLAVGPYWYGGNALFEDQMICNLNSMPGDSGSVVYADDGSNDVVGLLFAGGGGLSVVSRIDHVQDALGIVPTGEGLITGSTSSSSVVVPLFLVGLAGGFWWLLASSKRRSESTSKG